MARAGRPDLLEVYCCGEKAAELRLTPKGCRFDCLPEFLASSSDPVAYRLPRDPDGLEVEGLANLPTFFAGLLPEGVVMEAVSRMTGVSRDNLFGILAAVGHDAVGDVTVREPGAPPRPEKPISLQEARLFWSDMKRATGAPMVTAIPGVFPKFSAASVVGSRRTGSFIYKFPLQDYEDVVENEMWCMSLAKRCGLAAAEARAVEGVLEVRRFDRASQGRGQPLRQIHVEDVLQIADRYPNAKYSMEYVDVLRLAADLPLPPSGLLEMLACYAFSWIIGNGDMHEKNVSFLYDRSLKAWSLAPAYDLVSTLAYDDVKMALALIDEAHGRFVPEDFVAAGRAVGLPEKAVVRRLSRLATAALRELSRTAPPAIIAPLVETMEERARALG